MVEYDIMLYWCPSFFYPLRAAVKKQKKTLKPVTKVITINLSKLTHDVCYKKKAPRAIKEIRNIAGKLMHTKVRMRRRYYYWAPLHFPLYCYIVGNVCESFAYRCANVGLYVHSSTAVHE